MDKKWCKLIVWGVVVGVLSSCGAADRAKGAVERIQIVIGREATALEKLAAKEVRRYWYLRTARLAEIHLGLGDKVNNGQTVVIADKRRIGQVTVTGTVREIAEQVADLGPEQYILKTLGRDGKRVVLIIGGDPVGTLYGAYRFVEHLGVRFYLHGDTIPDERWVGDLPVVEERGEPLFSIRGIQPFHDFPEGPDWWNVDDYKAILAQLAKLRMNFIGLHTYPQGGAGPEPTVWIGLKEDISPDGSVRFSYPSSYQNTLRGNWGYSAKKTSDFTFGAAELFERDDYGAEVMFGAMPWPQTAEQQNAVFNRVGTMLREAFAFGHLLGIRSCVGTETPLVIPDRVKERLRQMGKDPEEAAVIEQLYEGIFERIARTYPLDYYWFWTPEHWTWAGPKEEQVEATIADLRAAISAAERVKAGFGLATCGWVLGPPSDRALFDKVLPKHVAVSCINRNVGFAKVERGFVRVQGRAKWAIPWLEDDPALTIPQLWVGRMRRDAADALAYGCTGLIGIHWRTRILGPNISALARAGWEQPWNPELGKKYNPEQLSRKPGREGGNVAMFPNSEFAGTEEDAIYQTVVWDVKAYRLKVPNGRYTVTLKFCEPHYNAAGKRVFGVELEGKRVIDKLDVFARVGKNKALDLRFSPVDVNDGLLEIRFVKVVEYPCIAGFVVEGDGFKKKINCGGGAWGQYSADLPPADVDGRPRDLPAKDFYLDWARNEFGRQVGEAIAAVFTKLDGGPDAGQHGPRRANLPRPATWVNGPGGIRPDPRPWEQVQKEYAFIQDLEKLRGQVHGAGNLERFDYWLNNLRYLRAVGKVRCTWARFNKVLAKAKKQKDIKQRKRLLAEEVLPVRKELVEQVGQVHRLLLSTVSTTGGMGTVANWQQHILPSLLEGPGRELAELTGGDLADEVAVENRYEGPARLIVPTVRSCLLAGEDLRLKVIALGPSKVSEAKLFWRPLGAEKFASADISHVARAVYKVRVSGKQIAGRDFEYYIKVRFADGQSVMFPATAGTINQTVVVIDAELPKNEAYAGGM